MSNDLDYDFDQDIKIDPDALDIEWLDQPTMFKKYARLHAQALKKAKLAAERLKTIRSELRLEAAEEGEELIGCKPTADNVDAWVRAQPKYQKAKKDQIDAEFEADILDGSKYAFHQRKVALQELVNLHNMQYFAGPREPRDLSGEYSMREKGMNQRRTRAAKKSRSGALRRTT